MIMPSASLCTPRMEPLINIFDGSFADGWISIWDERPSKLFDGVDQQLAIHLYRHYGHLDAVHITAMQHWAGNERCHVFQTLSYTPIKADIRYASVLPKVNSSVDKQALAKLLSVNHVSIEMLPRAGASSTIHYRNAGGRYWRLVKSFPSYFRSEAGAACSSTEKTMSVSRDHLKLLVSILSSSTFYWYWRIVSNCRHLTDRELLSIPIAPTLLHGCNKERLEVLAQQYELQLRKLSKRLVTQNQRSGKVVQDVYRVSACKPIIDEIDRILAKHYGFTDEELDFIINYDIKYRMGGAEEEE